MGSNNTNYSNTRELFLLEELSCIGSNNTNYSNTRELKFFLVVLNFSSNNTNYSNTREPFRCMVKLEIVQIIQITAIPENTGNWSCFIKCSNNTNYSNTRERFCPPSK
mgnify:CR=1 FL=1